MTVETAYTAVILAASITVNDGTAYVTDAQLFALLLPDVEPVLPFEVKTFSVE